MSNKKVMIGKVRSKKNNIMKNNLETNENKYFKKELIQKIESLMEQSKKEKIFFLLGHLPLDYFHESLSFTQWGIFSEFSLNLGLEIASHFSDKKEIEFLFLVDDKGSVEEIKALKLLKHYIFYLYFIGNILYAHIQ